MSCSLEIQLRGGRCESKTSAFPSAEIATLSPFASSHGEGLRDSLAKGQSRPKEKSDYLLREFEFQVSRLENDSSTSSQASLISQSGSYVHTIGTLLQKRRAIVITAPIHRLTYERLLGGTSQI